MLVDGVDVRDLDPEALWRRIGLVPQKPYLFSGTVAQQPALRQAGRHRRGAVGRRCEIAQAARLRRGDARRARRADRPGRHQRLRRPAAAAGDRPGARPPARRSTCSTTRSRRSTSPPTPGCGPRCAPVTARRDRGHRRPAGLHDPRRRPDRRARGRPRSSASAPTTSCSTTCPTYAEIVESQLRRGGGGMSDRDRAAAGGAAPAAAARPARRPDGRHGHAGREVAELRPVGPAAARPAAPGAARVIVGARARRSSASALQRARPEDPRPRDRPHLRRRHRPSSCPPGITKAAGGRRARAPRATTTSPTCSPAIDVVPGAGHRLRRARRTCCCWSLGALRRRRRCFGWLQGYLLNGVVQRTDLPAARRRRGQAQPAAAALLRPAAARRAAQPGHQRHRQHRAEPAADAEPAAHLAADGRRRADR